MQNSIKIVVYRWAGQKWFFRIKSYCVECEVVTAQIKRLLSAHPDWPVKLEVKPWLTHLWEALRHGGWHAPIVVVNGRLASQGRIPFVLELEQAVQKAVARVKKRPGFWAHFWKYIPPAPS
ncbi:MAG: hypothetical protein L0Z53_01665 [Acidobacteriales bacterium]|nr:hypothetical protein [Terriglobales bacterium]